MKIIGIGRNYVEHAKELGNEIPEEPVIFLKPETSLLLKDRPFYYPDFSNDIHYEVEIIYRICDNAKYVNAKFAHRYYDAVGIGIDFTARDLQKKAKEKGLPWTLAKGFNSSAPVSPFIAKEKFDDLGNISFSLICNGEVRQQGNTSLMMFNIDHLIAHISKYILLKKGDIIFTGTPKGVGAIKKGDVLEAYIEKEKLLKVEIK